jgi:hypothetical protein
MPDNVEDNDILEQGALDDVVDMFDDSEVSHLSVARRVPGLRFHCL